MKQKRLNTLEKEAIDIIKSGVENGAYFSLSGGRDSEVIYHLAEKNNLLANGLFTNSAIEPKGNRKRISEYKKKFDTVVDAKYTTKTYNEIVYKFGFPIKNKQFSDLCYRVRTKPTKNNISDKFRLITGVSPSKIDFKVINSPKKLFSLPLKFWFLALNYPIQSSCCRVLKKDPSAKLKKNMIIGIMADDSLARRRAIKANFHGKFFPLANWRKQDIADYIKKEGAEFSNEYKDKIITKDITITGAVSTGCTECHFGQKDERYIKIRGAKIRAKKFEIMKIVSPKKYTAMIKRKHSSGIDYETTIKAFEDSEKGYYLKASIKARNSYIEEVIKLIREVGIEKFDKRVIPILKSFII